MDIKKRKTDHIRIALEEEVETTVTTWFEYVKLIHHALPELNFGEVRTDTYLFGKKFGAPILIEAITGGTPLGAEINKILSELAEKYNLPFMVGSQRVAIENPELAWTFKTSNEANVFLIGNIGAQELVEYGQEEIEQLLDMINADALAVHLNPLQEIVQPEASARYKDITQRLHELPGEVDVPILVKETGAGISKEVSKLLQRAGIDAVDVSGVGGTSWSAIEHYRGRERKDRKKAALGKRFWDWGIPTAASIMEVKNHAKHTEIIASGGIRNGVDIVKALALGADFTGFALPFLKALYKTPDSPKNVERVEEFVERVLSEIKTTLYLTGCKTVGEIEGKEKVLLSPLYHWAQQRKLL